jgi:mRNA interferase RelE/StbE
MSFELAFVESALNEWRKLGHTIRGQLKRKLAERLVQPHVPADRLHGLPNCYRIKLRAAGYRLVYEVDDHIVTVTVIAVGRRDKGLVYSEALERRRERGEKP